MWDARLLTLYKQHYMDCYHDELKSEYSCWGYYDGMDIEEVRPERKGSLLDSASPAMISELWYHAGEKLKNITGHFGSINIGLFCDIPKEKEGKIQGFWDKKSRMPFFGVSFLQLDQQANCDEVIKKIKNEQVDESGRICRIYTYYTYDNADLVLVMDSNSLSILEEKLQEIDEQPEIRYQHSILGVSEKYLEDCKEHKQILECWHDKDCCINEDVFRLDIRLVSSGESQILNIEQHILDEVHATYKLKNYENAIYSYVSGHENIVLSFRDTDVKTMLVFLLPGGFATHQNISYRKRVDPKSTLECPRLFNIETTHVLKPKQLNEIKSSDIVVQDESEEAVETDNKPRGWFQKKIESYKDKLDTILDSGDESLYSYYLALLRTLNVLVQYENFSLSKDIFYLLYPSFEMFDKGIKKIEKSEKRSGEIRKDNCDGEYAIHLSTVKPVICEFLESVNSVIYHTIHTDQIYLMVPGYSGTSFSIPIKLNLVFLWFTDCIARLLGNKRRKYRCILVPTMEATPKTQWMKLEKETESFLVCAKISQRTLYMPKSLMIILAHEMGHYIGGNLRCRKFRTDQLEKFISHYLTDQIFPEGCIFDDNISELKSQFKLYTENELRKNLMLMENQGQRGHYGSEIGPVFKATCRGILPKCRKINTDNLKTIFK